LLIFLLQPGLVPSALVRSLAFCFLDFPTPILILVLIGFLGLEKSTEQNVDGITVRSLFVVVLLSSLILFIFSSFFSLLLFFFFSV
jgi:hypothetical protein